MARGKSRTTTHGSAESILTNLDLPRELASILRAWLGKRNSLGLVTFIGEIRDAARTQRALREEQVRVFGQARDSGLKREQPGLLVEGQEITQELLRMIGRVERWLEQVEILPQNDGEIIVPSVGDPVLSLPADRLYQALPHLQEAREELDRPGPDFMRFRKRGPKKSTTLTLLSLGPGEVSKRRLTRILRDRLLKAGGVEPPRDQKRSHRIAAKTLAASLIETLLKEPAARPT